MEAAPSVKPKRGSPPIPPNYVSLRQLQELRLKEVEEKQRQEAARKAEMEKQREEAARKAEMEAKQREEAARKAKMEAMATAAAVNNRDAARKPETKTPVRAKERRDGGPGAQWVAVAPRPAHPPLPPPLPLGEGVIPTVEGKPEGKGELAAITSAQSRTDEEPGRPAEASSHGGRPRNKGAGKAKLKEKASGDTSAEPGSIGGSGESAGGSSRRRKNSKGKKRAGGRSAEPSRDGAPAKPPGASPPQGVKLENAGNVKSPVPKHAEACPVSVSSDGKKADAGPAPPTSAASGSVGELRTTVGTKPERLVEEHRRAGRRAWPRPPGDRCNGAREQHGRVWVPKAAAGCAEL